MEHTIAAPHDGTVAELLYAPGDQVSEGDRGVGEGTGVSEGHGLVDLPLRVLIRKPHPDPEHMKRPTLGIQLDVDDAGLFPDG